MNPWLAAAIPIIALFVLGLGVSLMGVTPPQWVGLLFVIPTTAWATAEAIRLEMHKYKNTGGPGTICAGCLLLWIVVFPAFLYTRQRILNGTAVLRPQYLNQLPEPSPDA